MKKVILFIIVFLCVKLYAQNQPVLPNGVEHSLSPNGLFDKVFDHYGNSYNLSDIMINKDQRGRGNLKTTNSTPLSCGYYNLYFEAGSGMEDISNPLHVARRDVLCRVLTDLSNFINSPLTTNGLNNKVNIWVRNINNVIEPPNSPNGVLGLATAFYTVPYNTTVGFGGIVDNEIWKTIHLGKDSYTNVISPITSSGIDSGQPGVFYHGMMAFNFSDPAISWNTNLTVTSFPNQYDLYTVILHEMIHALGFASLINANGSSKFNAGYNYYTRYDTRLKNNANTQFLINKQTNACGSMYNYVFNTSLSPSILQSNDNCTQSVRYVGLSNVRVHTPATFFSGSSLSHFEGACISPNPNFVMESHTPEEVIRRFPKPQERNVLGDMGYNVKNTFGISSTYQGTTTYTGTLSGINVAGMNDGISPSGGFTYSGNANTDIQISNFLANDTNATGFECLEDIYHTSSLSATSGNSSTIITFNSSEGGLHLLRYTPTNGTQRGNISYIYVYVESANNCGTPTACNLVINGDFEDFLPSSGSSNIDKACNWSSANQASPDYFNSNYTNPAIQTPCNTYGFEEDIITSNGGYAGMYILFKNNYNYSEPIKTQLLSPLLPDTNYQLTFDVSLAEKYSHSSIRFQAYLSDTFTTYSEAGAITIDNPNMLFTDVSHSNITDGWNKIIFNFTTDNIAGQNTLYIGGLTIQDMMDNVPAPLGVGGCNYVESENIPHHPYSYYYIDNVSLIPLNGGSFVIPESICLNELISDLSDYLDNVPLNGTFSGGGVSGNVFDSSIAGVGIHTITYTYTNPTGCPVSISSKIEVLSSNNSDCINCQEYFIFSGTENLSLVTYNASDYIETNSNYLVNSTSDVFLKASNYIVMKPQSQINSGAQFLARIENCDGTSNAKIINPVKTSENFDPISFSENNELLDTEVLGLKIYPNPSDGLINISNTTVIENVIITDMNGRIVKNIALEASEGQINISDLSQGVYILNITSNGKSFTKKIIKQ